MIIAMTISIATAIEKISTEVELPVMNGVSPRMELTIPFDKPIQADSINKSSIYVTDSKGKRVDVFRQLSLDGKSIKIIPVEPYQKGAEYKLWIRGSLKYEPNESIAKSITMRFAVASIEEELPKLASYENLKSILETYAAKTFHKLPAKSGLEGELELEKAAGEYKYLLSNGILKAIKVSTKGDEEQLGEIDVSRELDEVYELMVYERYIVAVGSSKAKIKKSGYNALEVKDKGNAYYINATVKLLVYDSYDKSNIKLVRELELEGYYQGVRQIGSIIYLTANREADHYQLLFRKDINPTPSFRDTVMSKRFLAIDYNSIACFPEIDEAAYLTTAGIDLSNPGERAAIAAYFGIGSYQYTTDSNMYVAIKGQGDLSSYYSSIMYSGDSQSNDSIGPETYLYRFYINGTKLEYTGKATIPGILEHLNPIEESEGKLKVIAGEAGPLESRSSSSSLYVLDHNMDIISSTEL